MKRYCLLFLFSAISVWNSAAQDAARYQNTEEPPVQTPITAYVYEPIRKGDQFIRMGLQLGVPLFNTSPSKFAIKPNIYPGGSIFLGYTHYLTKGVSVGGDLAFSFYLTKGSNLYFAIPFTFNTGYTFAAGKMRFPLTFGIGGDFQSYNGTRYFGLFFRPQAGFFYQYSPEWSFGGELSWDIVPQWYKNKSFNRTGNFLGIGFAARYHF
ncbi:MAG: hypothetical protein P1P65_03090 [Treponema sp.]